MRPHVFIATPCYGGVVTQGYMQSVVALIQQASTDGYDVTLALLGQDALITRSRNTLLAHFMARGDTTHILFIDSDISFDRLLPGRLLASRKDVVAATYPIKTHYWDEETTSRLERGELPCTAALRYVGELCGGPLAVREGDFATANFVGTGFMMISRLAIEHMIECYPETRYKTIHAYPDAQTEQHVPYALFEAMIDPTSQIYLSEDFGFCLRWRSLGGQIWLDTRSPLTHSGSTEFNGVPITAFEPVRHRHREPPSHF